MTLRHLKIFITVYEEMSITKASNKIPLAQPSVSLAIRELEEHYQVKLFDRINRRIYPTDKGDKFYEYSTHIMELYEEMENHMLTQDAPVHLSLGSSITIGNYIVPELIANFSKLVPSCKVNVQIQNSNQIIQLVQKNMLDIGLVEDHVEADQLLQIPFMKDQLYFVCRNAHPLAKKSNVSLKEICDFPLFLRESGSASREITDGLIKSFQLKPLVTWESVSNQALLFAIKCNNGITVLPEKIIENGVRDNSIRILPCYPDSFLREFTMIFHKNKYITPALAQLIKLVQME